MVYLEGHSFWTDEVYCLDDDVVVRPYIFFEDEVGELHGEGFNVVQEERRLNVSNERTTFKVAALGVDSDQRDKLQKLPLYLQEEELRHGNPLRVTAGNKKVYSVPIGIFCDDLSGNKSKKWNKHEALYFSNLLLDRALLDLDAHTHFLSVSASVTATAQLEVVVTALIDVYNNPITVFDVLCNELVLVRPFLLAAFCDNPMAAELSASIGLNGNLFCRLCDADGSLIDTRPKFEQYLRPGRLRCTVQQLYRLDEQIKAAKGGVKVRVDELRKRYGVKDVVTESAVTAMIGFARANQNGPARDAEELRLRSQPWHGPLLRLRGELRV
ncbi:unnamed protein product [Tilletia caries]